MKCQASANVILPEQQQSKILRRSQSPLQSQSPAQRQSQAASRSLPQQLTPSPAVRLQLKLQAHLQSQGKNASPLQQSQSQFQSEKHPHAVPQLRARPLDATGVHRMAHSVMQARPPIVAFQVSQDSSRLRLQLNDETKDGTPKKQKQCNCKNSRCLKLYCECFASGVYCDGCNCMTCHNNTENESATQDAIRMTLERNPNAFKPKIACSPHKSCDAKEDVGEAQMAGKHNKGCHCKKSGCLKKYCECFQANIMCSDNCKCMDCKNVEGSEERMVLIHGDSNALINIQANGENTGATESSGYGTFLASKKRKSEHIPLGLLAKDQPFCKIAPDIQENNVRTKVSSSVLSVPISGTANAEILRTSKVQYRSPLVDIIHRHDVTDLCSLLVVSSVGATKRLAERGTKMQTRGSKASPTQNMVACKNGDNVQKFMVGECMTAKQADVDSVCDSGSDEYGMQNGRPMSPETLALMCDEKDAVFDPAGSPARSVAAGSPVRSVAAGSPASSVAACQNKTQKSPDGHECTDVYARQERLVLTRLRDFLNRIITCGSIKETMCSLSAKK